MFYKILIFVFLIFLFQGGLAQESSPDEKCRGAVVSQRGDLFSKIPLNQEKYSKRALSAAMRGALSLPQILSMYSPLPNELQSRLLKTYQENGRDRSSPEFAVIFLSTYRLVYKIVKQLTGGPRLSNSFKDYFQTALIQLIDCIDKFDFSRNVSFGTYAGLQMRYSVMSAMTKNKPISGANSEQIMATVKRAIEKSHFSSEGAEPALDRVLNQHPVSLRPQIMYWYRVYTNSLTKGVDVYQGEPFMLKTDNTSHLHESIDVQIMREYALNMFSDKPKYLAVIEDRIFSPSPVFHRILSERFGVSVARMQEIERFILRKLREKFFLPKGAGDEEALRLEGLVSNRLRKNFLEFSRNQNLYEGMDIQAMRDFAEAEFLGRRDYLAVIRSRIFSSSPLAFEELAQRLKTPVQRLRRIEDDVLVKLWERLVENQDENLYESQAEGLGPALNQSSIL